MQETIMVVVTKTGMSRLLICDPSVQNQSHVAENILKLSFSYVQKEEKMGFNMVQKTFICDN